MDTVTFADLVTYYTTSINIMIIHCVLVDLGASRNHKPVAS